MKYNKNINNGWGLNNKRQQQQQWRREEFSFKEVKKGFKGKKQGK